MSDTTECEQLTRKILAGNGELRPGMGIGAPVATANPDHQPIVPLAGGVPPRCTCGVVGGNGFDRPLLADHLKEMDPSYAQVSR